MYISQAQIKEFCMQVRFPMVSDRKLFDAIRESHGVKHCRSGKIKIAGKCEGNGVEVLAYGFDELGNVLALCKDGIERQYLRG